MIIYPRHRTYQLPICKHCTNVLTQTGLLDKRGDYWHANCYEEHIETLLDATIQSLDSIVGHTQETCAAGNTMAHRAIVRINNGR